MTVSWHDPRIGQRLRRLCGRRCGGEWDFDLSTVNSPVLLWYGSDDRIVPPARGLWLSQNLPRARLVVRDGDGHLGTYDHLGEMLDALTEPG